ncbi:MAG TPA: diaminopimelate epimerase [Nitriliruptorales bacterium]|nr:diaminopimelate epimerase [Nitriliruptorales bacterium]
MRFWKAHGAGNDFVLLVDPDQRLDLTPALVRALCDRRHGVGADGVLRLIAGAEGTDVFMDHRNADGSAAATCGNGVRVVAKHVVDHAEVIPTDGRVRVGTRAGTRTVTVHRGPEGRVVAASVDMGAPALRPRAVPFHADGPQAIDEPVDVDGRVVRVSAVSMGNPHAVVLVDDVASAPVSGLGAALEVHERFPERTNVEFVQPLGDGRVRVRVWERGVGETAACGSGACAVAVALHARGRAGDELIQLWPGGELTTRYAPTEHPSVVLTGPAVEVAQGILDPLWLQRVAA